MKLTTKFNFRNFLRGLVRYLENLRGDLADEYYSEVLRILENRFSDTARELSTYLELKSHPYWELVNESASRQETCASLRDLLYELAELFEKYSRSPENYSRVKIQRFIDKAINSIIWLIDSLNLPDEADSIAIKQPKPGQRVTDDERVPFNQAGAPAKAVDQVSSPIENTEGIAVIRFSGKAKIAISARLLDDWSTLADYLDVPLPDRRAFISGKEACSLWEWLEQRDRLDELEEALEAIGRADLVEILKNAD